MKTYFKMTFPRHEIRLITIHEYNGYKLPTALEDYAPILATQSLNDLAHDFAVLRKYVDIMRFYDFAITYDAARKEYRLWVYSRNWKARAHYYAGLIEAHNLLRERQRQSRKKVKHEKG